MLESDKQEFTLRCPTVDDGVRIWRLVRETGVLDENSVYAYLLLCRDFSRTSLVAECRSQLAGFVTAYRLPQRPQVLFVWQIGVSQFARRQGLALKMLSELVARNRAAAVARSEADMSAIKFVEATVAPSNSASRRLFDAFAAKLGAPLKMLDGFSEAHFPPGGHEAEPLICIGPLPGL
jgi:L-2,4-diaminobutyric acid acetyltransferase